MVSIRYFCGVGEFCRMKSSPRGVLISNSGAGTAVMAKAMPQRRIGIQAMGRMTRVTWEPSQLAYRAQPILHTEEPNSCTATGAEGPANRRQKPATNWQNKHLCHPVG